MAVDGTGYLHFTRPHCAQCLVRHFDHGDVFLHMVEEAKLVGPGGLVVSLATTFIENADLPAAARSTTWKQDCELSAFKRLLPMLHAACPQLRVCLTSDALYACGPVLEAMATYGWAYVFTFKAGHLPTAWADFQALLPLCPENCLRVTLPRGGQQVYRWVTGMAYVDTRQRVHTFQAIQCEETVAGTTTTFAWMTNLPVTRDTVMAIAMKGGRRRWLIENQGFNLQKNSELNLEHAYSEDPDGLKTYYYLLQIAHTMLQLLEHGSLLHHLAADVGQDPGATLWQSQKHCPAAPRGFPPCRPWRRHVGTDSNPLRHVLTAASLSVAPRWSSLWSVRSWWFECATSNPPLLITLSHEPCARPGPLAAEIALFLAADGACALCRRPVILSP